MPEFDDQIVSDHLCWNCRYNLRGLAISGQCPECGQSIDLNRKPLASRMNRAFAYSATAIIIFLIAATVLLDVALAATAMPKYVLVVGLIALWVAVPAWLSTRSRAVLVSFVTLTLLLSILPFVPTSPGNPFLRFFKQIRGGRTQAEVISKLDRCFPDRIKNRRPWVTRREDELLCIVRDPHDGRYNAEVIFLEFRNGRLVSKEWSPD